MSKKSKKAVTEAIQDSGGIVLEIARRLDISWATAKTYIEKWEDTKALFEDESEKVLDIAEQTIIKSIKAGDTSDAKWLLSRKGKARGYVERIEQENSGMTKVIVEYVDTVGSTDTAT